MRTLRLLTLLALAGCGAEEATAPAAPQAQAPGGKGDAIDDGEIERAAWLLSALRDHNAGVDGSTLDDKYAKMAASPHAFYRGTAHLLFADLSVQATRGSAFHGPDSYTWLQGDAHALNFGVFDDDRGHVVYGLNDFDEATPGPYLLDLWRLGASLALIAAEHPELDAADAEAAIQAMSEAYLDALDRWDGGGGEKDAQFEADDAPGPIRDLIEEIEADESPKKMLAKWTVDAEAGRRFDLRNPKLAPVPAEARAALLDAFEGYADTLKGRLRGDEAWLTIKDMAYRLDQGTGSLGTPRIYLLIEGKTRGWEDDHILDVKGQGYPAPFDTLEPGLQRQYRALFGDDHGCRVALGQQALDTRVDDHLGCVTLGGQSYSVRERSPFKATFDPLTLTRRKDLKAAAALWGEILATGHARADRDFNEEIIPGGFEQAVNALTEGKREAFHAEVREISTRYAERAQKDYAIFVEALASGRALGPQPRGPSPTPPEAGSPPPRRPSPPRSTPDRPTPRRRRG